MLKFCVSLSSWMFIVLVVANPALAEVTQIQASRDNTLYEDSQGSLSNGSGDYLFVGRTNANGVRRAVIAFDDLSSIPAGSTIDSVRLHLQLSKERSAATTLKISSLVSDWGEGSSNADGEEGGGTAATQSDATWVHTFFDSQTWLNPGGDFMEVASAELEVDAAGTYTIESTEAMVNNVQGWLDDPDINFGWILTAGESSTTSKRFNSRENPAMDSGPQLEVTYTPPDEQINNWSGPWFDQSLDGEGFLIYDTAAGWIIYFFGFTQDEELLWLISRVTDIGDPVPNQSYRFQMTVATPGTFDNPTPSDQLAAWGTLDVNFADCNNAVFVLESPSLNLSKVSNVVKIIDVEGSKCVDE